ncbi:MAG: chromosome segregation protein SMC, partial [Anaerolineae bacterium]|nr:chromosome segregation protein SMC [Anaerolineae bacterium]
MRWVLGEQSYSLLRGRKTDDMIFAGSDTRAQAGMASATLVFDNSDGWLPIDFSEVSVTRRAYRDGQNEYLINNQKVRLKDITELLSQSGLAERTYTVIGQGLVDAALSLNSAERRRLFEEAAGIGIYRTRKDQSLRRLDKTRRNLERVQDILAELKPRLRSLKRQSAKAIEHSQVKKDLQEILREWYGYHWHKAQSELKDVKDLASIQEANYLKVQSDEQRVTKALQENRENIHLLRERLAGWHKELAEKHSRREELNRDLAVGDERERSLEGQKADLRKEIAVTQEEVGLKQARLHDAQQRVDQAGELLDEAKEMASAARSAYEERRASRQEIEQRIESGRQELDRFSNQKISFQARRISFQDSVLKYEQEQEQAEQRRAVSQTEFESAEKQVKSLDANLNDRQEKIKKVEASLVTERDALQTLEKQRDGARKSLHDREARVSRLVAEKDVLDKAEASLIGFTEGAKLLVEAARSKRVAGSKGVLSSFMNVPAEYEVAIAAAMGEFVDSFLLDENSAADQAIDLLLQKGARASLVPVRGVQSGRPLAVPDNADCLGVASTLVETPPDLRPVVDALLGHVLVARSRAAARQLLSNQPAHVRAVTLAGELFHPSGAVFVDSKGGSGVISRPRQRRELDDQLGVARRDLKSHQGELDDLSAGVEGKRTAIASLESERQSAREAWQGAVERQRAAVLNLEQVKRRREWESEQIEKLTAERDTASASMQEIEQSGSQLEDQIAKLEERLRADGYTLTDTPLDELQDQFTHWQTQLALAETGMQENAHRRDEQSADLDKTRARIDDLQSRLTALESQKTQISEGMTQSRQVEDDLAAQIDAVQALILPAEEELRTLEADQTKFLAEDAEARKVLNVAERNSSQSQIVLARQQEALEALRLRIEDDFGLVDFEYQDQVSGPTPLPLGDLVEHLPMVAELSPDIEETLKQKRAQLRRIGSVYPEAKTEFDNVQERYDFLSNQVEDLTKAEKDIREVIAELDGLMDREFRKTFEVVAAEFKENFSRLFGGGSARLLLSGSEDIHEAGVDIETRLPGKRSQRLALLSGGERSLTAAALVFSLLKASPTPFCVMDEVDAMLDEANIGRFREILSEFSQQTQFVVITHNRNTVQAAEMIYGVTMGRDTASQIISLKLDDVDERYAPQGA